MSENLSSRASKIIYTIIGLAVGILVFVALLPTIDSAFTDLIANVTSSSNFSDFVDFAEILPMFFFICMFGQSSTIKGENV